MWGTKVVVRVKIGTVKIENNNKNIGFDFTYLNFETKNNDFLWIDFGYDALKIEMLKIPNRKCQNLRIPKIPKIRVNYKFSYIKPTLSF